ncbi:hypothetical protein ACTJIJ_17590 [Niabella sp. 22666]|uniref:hypothetical protein n=1 Tax=Niabella sp. 22666 TaxID=3453954 RepID=UPI003F875461
MPLLLLFLTGLLLNSSASAKSGSGQGVKRYAWSAAQYIQLLIEDILGIDYNRFTGKLKIIPNLSVSLKNEKPALRHLKLPVAATWTLK